jgi:hypothetical protein
MLSFTNFFKLIGLIPSFTIFQFGGGSGSSTTTPTLTPEQADLLKTQTEAYKNTFLPSYQKATGGAQNVYEGSTPYLNQAAIRGFNQSTTTADQLNQPSLNALGTSSKTLASIISPDYIKNQIAGYLQPVQEQNREANNALFAQYGGSGQLGSSRAALAESSLGGLNAARLQAAGTNAISNITGQQIGAASTLGNMGFQGIGTSLGASQAAIGYANAPTDLYSKYASILYGTPQSATPNFTGTVGSTTSGSGTNFILGTGK